MFADLTQEQLSALEAQHGPVYRADTPQGAVYVKAPNEGIVDAFMDARAKAGVRRAQNDLVKRCLVSPTWADYEPVLKRFCMLSVNPAELIIEVSQGVEEARVTKSGGEASTG